MGKGDEVFQDLLKIGVPEHDALVLADCIVSRKSCSWVNNDTVTDKLLADLRSLIEKKNYGIRVDVQPVPTRNKFIWEVKVNS